MSLWQRLVSPGKALYCSFCGAHRSAVGYLVAGPDAYICENCVVTCVAVIDGQQLNAGASQLWTVYRTLPALVEGVTPQVRAAHADRFIDIAETIVGDDGEMLRWAAALARYLNRSARCCALLQRIGERDRDAALDLAAALCDLGKFAEAREAIELLQSNPEVDAARLLIRLGRRVVESGASSVEMGPIERVAAVGEKAGVRFAQPARVIDAALELRRGQPARVRELLNEYHEERQLTPVAALIFGSALEKQGEGDLARAAWRAALALAPPAGWLETALQARLGHTPYGERDG